ncbi:MAG: hypothetical protein ACR2MG_17570 [Pyrinomonadaceae bacterium]
MQTAEHISAEAIERYAIRKSALAEMLAVQRHIAVCEMCREKLAEAFDAEKAFVGLQNELAFDDFSDEPEHLPYEQLALFVDGKLDAVESEITESHLAICAECKKDLADLRVFRQIADAPPFEKAETKSFWQRLFAFDSFGGFAPAASVAAVLFAVLTGAWFLLRSNQRDEIAQANANKISASPSPISNGNPQNTDNQNTNSQTNFNANSANIESNQSPTRPTENVPNQSPELAFSDGQITVDQNGDVRGLENLSPSAQKAIRQSLQTGKVSVGANSLGGNNGVLMGGGDETGGVPFALHSPVGKVVRESQPILRWKPLKDATSYNVAVADANFRVVVESGKLTSTSWKPAKSLPRGATYSWQVTATKADGSETVSPSAPAPQARFRVLDQKTTDDLNKLEKTKSHLALGVLYATAGLIEEARREFQVLVKENPKSALARKLLAGVR